MSNILDPVLPCKQRRPYVEPLSLSIPSNQQSFRNLYRIKSFFFFLFIFDDLSTPKSEVLLRISAKTRSTSKISLVMTLLHLHYPTHFLSVVGDSVARYLLPTSLTVIHFQQYFPGYIRSVYVQNNPKKVRAVLYC